MIKGFMINCKEATELVVKQSGETLGFWMRMQLWIHLSMCQFCSLFEKQNHFIDHHVRKLDEMEAAEMDSQVKDKILFEITHSGNPSENSIL